MWIPHTNLSTATCRDVVSVVVIASLLMAHTLGAGWPGFAAEPLQ